MKIMKLFKGKLTALALAAGMVFSAVPSIAFSQSTVYAADKDAEVHIWDGTSDVSWYDDEETEFHISTPEQLAGLSELTNTGKTMEGKTFILDNDLYMNDVSGYDEWETTPPENTFNQLSTFNGSILGNGHRVIGLYMVNSGFISSMTKGYISNLHFEDLLITGTGYYIGGIVDSTYYSRLENCTVQGNINTINNKYEIKSYSYDGATGGLVGKSFCDYIIGCTNFSTISSYKEYGWSSIGGICGQERDSQIYACINAGSIKGLASNVGGICGSVPKYFVRYGVVYSDLSESSGSFKQCINKGAISSDDDGRTGGYGCGGIVGYIEPIVTNKNEAGIVTIQDCYNSGIINEENNIYNSGRCGGIAGRVETGRVEKSAHTVLSCYNTGIVYQGYALCSGLYDVDNVYYLTGTAEMGTGKTPDPAIAKSEPNMKKESFADALGDAFYYVEGEFPKLAFEVGRTVSEFDKTSLAFKEFGETQTLTLDTTYLGEPAWVSSDTSVATVDSEGVVTAVGNGTAMIYALCSDSKAACSVTVGYDYYLSDNELSLKKGRVHDLAVYSASTGKEVTDIDVEWSSSDDSIVSVDSEGTITTNAVGTAAITAKVADIELSSIISVYEYQVPAVVVPDDENAPKLSETDFTISANESKLLNVENYSDSITWVSANTSIAKVNKNGLVKGVSEGNTAVYALLSDGRCLKANATITKSEYTMGDVNKDGDFNVSDVVLLQKWLLAVPDTHLANWKAADFCEDDRLDVFDLCMMKRELITQSK